MAEGRDAGARPRNRQAEFLLGLSILLVAGFVIHDWSAQPASRYALTVALVDDHRLEIDDYEEYLDVDQARFDGHVYSDKPPYQPFLAAPAYQAYRLAGGDPFPEGFSDGDFEEGVNYGQWWVTFWSSVLPAVALAIVIRRMVACTHPDLATRVALATMLGTTILPFAGWLFGHVLAALCVAGAWHLLRPPAEAQASDRSVFAAGCLLGAGIGAEYPVAVIALVMLGHVALWRRWRPVVALSAGTVLATLPLLLYNWLVFRDPFEVSYQGHLPNFEGEGAFGVYNLRVPDMEEVSRALFGNRGLFVATPIIILALVGVGLAIAERGPTRRDAWMGLLALVAMVVVSTGIDGYGGDSPGPRYLIPALPLLAVPIAQAWRRLPLLCGLATLVGMFTMGLAMLTDPSVDTADTEPLPEWIDAFREGDLATNVLTGHAHPWVLLVTTGLGLAVALVLLIRDRPVGAAAPVTDP